MLARGKAELNWNGALSALCGINGKSSATTRTSPPLPWPVQDLEHNHADDADSNPDASDSDGATSNHGLKAVTKKVQLPNI